MIANAIFTENFEEIQEAKRLDLPLPSPELVADAFGFYLSDIRRFHRTTSGNIRVYFNDGSDWTLEYSDIVLNRLLEMFKE